MVELLAIAIAVQLFIVLVASLFLAGLMVTEIVLDSLGRDYEKVEYMIRKTIPPLISLAFVLLILLLAYIVILGI